MLRVEVRDGEEALDGSGELGIFQPCLSEVWWELVRVRARPARVWVHGGEAGAPAWRAGLCPES